MLMIRLQRVGRKNDPSFRVVVVDSKEAAQTGKVIEVVGSHSSIVERTELKADRIKYWLSVGAKASDTVNNLLVTNKIIEGAKIDVASKKLGKKAQAAVEAKKAAEEKAAAAKAKAEEVVAEPVIDEVKEEAPVAEPVVEEVVAE